MFPGKLSVFNGLASIFFGKLSIFVGRSSSFLGQPSGAYRRSRWSTLPLPRLSGVLIPKPGVVYCPKIEVFRRGFLAIVLQSAA
jgi:hypothetical protein